MKYKHKKSGENFCEVYARCATLSPFGKVNEQDSKRHERLRTHCEKVAALRVPPTPYPTNQPFAGRSPTYLF